MQVWQCDWSHQQALRRGNVDCFFRGSVPLEVFSFFFVFSLFLFFFCFALCFLFFFVAYCLIGISYYTVLLSG